MNTATAPLSLTAEQAALVSQDFTFTCHHCAQTVTVLRSAKQPHACTPQSITLNDRPPLNAQKIQP